MTDFVMPSDRAIRDILQFMCGDGIEVTGADVGPADDVHAATYVGENDQLVAVCACDDNFVVYSGAALSMVPAEVAKEMAASKEFTDVVLDNFHEVMNICSRLMMSDDSPHLRLEKTMLPDAATAAISQIEPVAKAARFNVTIPSYGTGNIAFLVT